MNQEYAQYSGLLLSAAGFAYQWVRARKAVAEGWTGVFAVGLALAVYALCFDYSKHEGVQHTILFAVLWLIGNTTSVLGGTFAASAAAKAGVAAVPMTNSK